MNVYSLRYPFLLLQPAVEEESFQPEGFGETQQQAPQKSMDPADVKAFADALNEFPLDDRE